ncbi:PspC domain-containing protein [Pontibacter roseus]|uniref:PspC domain-containing protein n=1 Tax=Pontibacter roseus TaxID=336989 RepID=UPI00036080C5|nr:PspC domain-containing protein [Pontibacter roseus]
MKKNININLQGIIFHIEEDGYEQLSRYLTSIRNYFSSYEGHEEIVADIEARIAEIFATRLSPGKQVITLEDVQSLIAQMGDVTDFEILEPMEEERPFAGGAARPAGEPAAAAAAGTYTEARPKKLYRDVSRKVVSGVSAGIANYLNVDPLWIRLLFVFLVIGTPLTEGISGSFGLIAYIILWIALPVNYSLPEITVKKLFRDPSDKKLAGVASGIAKYFGVDVAVIRILFLALIFAGGFGILAYIILWIAVPEAATLTERMQMQGNPVTLSSIEHTLKENLNMKDHDGEESTAAKVVLLPFRLISQVINWLGRALGPLFAFLISMIRVLAGVMLLTIALGLTVALFTSLFISLGIVDNQYGMTIGDFPPSILLEGFPRLGLVAGFFVALIPILFLILLSIGLLAKRFFMRPLVGWSMLGVWLVSLFLLITTIAMHTNNFRRSGEVVVTQSIPVEAYPVITLDGYNTNSSYDNRIYFNVQGQNANTLDVQQRLQAKGKTEAEAQENARMISYRVVQNDSTIRFDNSFEFKPGAAYRSQRMDVTLMIPQDKRLRLTSSFLRMIPSGTFEEEYSREKTLRNLWQVKGDRLACLTCAADTLDDANDTNYAAASTMGMGGSVLSEESAYSSNQQTYEFSDFNEIQVQGPYHVQIVQGNSYAVSARGNEEDLEKLRIEKSGNTLEIEHKGKTFNLFDKERLVLIQITVPELRSLDLSGAITADVGQIKSDELNITLVGASKAFIDVNTNRLTGDFAGATKVTLVGRADDMDLDIAGASNLDAVRLVANTVNVEAVGACTADVYATNTLRADAAGASIVRYKGKPTNVVTDVSGASKVSRL